MPMDLRRLESAKSTRMGYLNKWKQELGIYKMQSYAPKLWGVMSFILPLALVPIAAKVGTKVYKEVKKKLK